MPKSVFIRANSASFNGSHTNLETICLSAWITLALCWADSFHAGAVETVGTEDFEPVLARETGTGVFWQAVKEKSIKAAKKTRRITG